MMETITLEKCSHCTTELGAADTYCNRCGFPERGTDEEKGRFYHKVKMRREGIEEAEKKVKNVKTLILVLAGINVLLGVYYLTNEITFAEGIVCIICAMVFVGCAIWINKQPVIGTLAAFFFWILLQLLAAVADPTSIFMGILLKIIFFGMFVKGIKSAREAQQLQKQLNFS